MLPAPPACERRRAIVPRFGAIALASLLGCAGGVSDDHDGFSFSPGLPDEGRDGTGSDSGDGADDPADDKGGEDGDEGEGTGASVPSGACQAGDIAPCYTGPAATEDVGPCRAGQATCVDGEWSACEGEALPSPEQCDGADNDCDGQIDNGNPGGGAACSTGQPGVCGSGTQSCVGGALSCQASQNGGAEVCDDGLDNDCNGQVDDGCSTCFHDPCLPGGPLDPGCDFCVGLICLIDSFCCQVEWDVQCVGEVLLTCGSNC
jgi:hypothetical protein